MVDSRTLGRRDLVVIGAGPVGIAALWFATRHRLQAVAVEAGSAPLAALRRFIPGLVMASTAREWEVDGLPVDCRDASEVTREDLVSYYSRVLSYSGQEVACAQRLVALEPAGGETRVTVATETGLAHWLAARVIVTPWYRLRALDLGALQRTGIQVVQGAETLPAPGEQIVVVGGGLSGLETCDYLIRAGLRVTLLGRRVRPQPELESLFAGSGSRIIMNVQRVSLARRGALKVEHDSGVSEVPCTVAINCTGHETNEELLGVLRHAKLLNDDEVRALQIFRPKTLLTQVPLSERAQSLPLLTDSIWTGRRGVHFAGTVFHVGGITGAGIMYSIETAKWAVAAAASAPNESNLAADTHLPTWFLSEAGRRSITRAPIWAGHVAAIVPVPVPTWSRGTKLFEGENPDGMTKMPLSHATRALGDARDETLSAVRDACYAGISVVRLLELLAIEEDELLWALRMLWHGNGLTWIPPHLPSRDSS